MKSILSSGIAAVSVLALSSTALAATDRLICEAQDIATSRTESLTVTAPAGLNLLSPRGQSTVELLLDGKPTTFDVQMNEGRYFVNVVYSNMKRASDQHVSLQLSSSIGGTTLRGTRIVAGSSQELSCAFAR